LRVLVFCNCWFTLRATELARAGRAEAAIPMFMQSLKEFERLNLPELQQIQGDACSPYMNENIQY
jgi:hypothetical protein